jgi:NAD-dependent deacetylase
MSELSGKTMAAIHCAADILRDSERTTVLTGAGISTPSGIPDFRGSESGLWSRYDPFEVASLTAFRYRPQDFFDWMRPLAVEMVKAQPNAAHIGLAQLEKAGYVHTLITQNIDSLHHRAGSQNVLEVHGSMRTMTCVRCFRQVDAGEYVQPYLDLGEIPHCPRCGAILKPDVILMEEQLPVQAWLQAVEASRSCDTMLVAGSSLEVVPVANLPMQAVDHGAHLIIINQSNTYIDIRADVVIQEDLVDVIPAIVDQLQI